jgi:hypothetical protein
MCERLRDGGEMANTADPRAADRSAIVPVIA